jgi:hypothetical protein
MGRFTAYFMVQRVTGSPVNIYDQEMANFPFWTPMLLSCCLPFPSSFLYNLIFGKLIALLATCFHTGFLLALFFDPEDGRDTFL